MILIGGGSILLAGLVWLPLSKGAGGLFTLFLVAALGFPAAVAAAVGLVTLIGGLWGLMGWPGRPLIMFAVGFAELAALAKILNW